MGFLKSENEICSSYSKSETAGKHPLFSRYIKKWACYICVKWKRKSDDIIVRKILQREMIRNEYKGFFKELMEFQTSNLCIEKFGASIEEYLGQDFPKDAKNTKKTDKKEESWW